MLHYATFAHVAQSWQDGWVHSKRLYCPLHSVSIEVSVVGGWANDGIREKLFRYQVVVVLMEPNLRSSE